MSLLSCKLVVVGDSFTGKTCLLISYTSNAFPGEYVPSVFDDYSANGLENLVSILNKLVKVGDRTISFSLWDTASHEDYDRLRPLSYPQTSIFLILFSCVNRHSLRRVKEKWVPEVSTATPGVPYILAASKIDLREDPSVVQDLQSKGEAPITYEEGLAMSKEIKAAKYCECSALTQTGIVDTFDAAMKVFLAGHENPTNRRACIIL